MITTQTPAPASSGEEASGRGPIIARPTDSSPGASERPAPREDTTCARCGRAPEALAHCYPAGHVYVASPVVLEEPPRDWLGEWMRAHEAAGSPNVDNAVDPDRIGSHGLQPDSRDDDDCPTCTGTGVTDDGDRLCPECAGVRR